MNTSILRSRWLLLIAFAATAVFVAGCDSVGSTEEEEGSPDESNNPPTAQATVITDTPVSPGTEVTLDASESSDPDGDDLTYSWSLQAPNDSEAALSDASAEQPTFTADVAGDYTATLEVSDGTDSDTDDVTITAEGGSATAELSSNVTSDRTLSPDSNYVVTSTICVQNSSTLTIEDGVTISFESGTGLKVCGDESALVANGTSSNGITMTGSTEQMGFWQGIGINSSNQNNELSGVTIEYAGGNNLFTFINGKASLQLKGGSVVTIENSTFRDNANYGLSAQDNVDLSGFSSNTFEGNGTAAMNVHATNLGAPDTGSSYGSYVRVNGGSISGETMTISPIEAPYRISGVRSIDSGSDVTVEDGTTFEFESGSGLKINGDATAFKANGTSSNGILMTGISEQQQAGGWNGIGINSSNTNNELSGVTIEYAGGSNLYTFINGKAGLQLKGGSAVTITNSTIRNNANYGLSAQDNVDLSGFSSNTFEGNGTAAMNVHATNLGAPDTGSSYGSYVRINGGSISGETMTISPIEVPYRLSGVRSIDSGSDVTVEDGTTFEFESSSGLKIDGDATAFKAQGTTSDGITMTGTTQQSGFWQGVGINSSNLNNELSGVTIEYAGGSNLYTFINGQAGLQIKNGGAVTITNSTIRNNANYGLSAQGGVDLSGFSNNTFEGNGKTSMNVYAENMGALDTGTSYGSHVRINDGSVSGETMTISPIEVPYRISGVRAIQNGSDVTVEAGTTFEFESEAGLNVQGDGTAFKAEGTEADSIRFTGTTKQKGFWAGVGFKSGNVNNKMSHVVVEYGGATNVYTFTDAANVQVNSDAQLTLENALIQDSGSYGLSSSDGTVAVDETDNTYRRNDKGARNF